MLIIFDILEFRGKVVYLINFLENDHCLTELINIIRVLVDVFCQTYCILKVRHYLKT